MKLTENQLIKIVGGNTSITASALNSVSKLIETVVDLGRCLGNAIRRIYNNDIC